MSVAPTLGTQKSKIWIWDQFNSKFCEGFLTLKDRERVIFPNATQQFRACNSDDSSNGEPEISTWRFQWFPLDFPEWWARNFWPVIQVILQMAGQKIPAGDSGYFPEWRHCWLAILVISPKGEPKLMASYSGDFPKNRQLAIRGISPKMAS
jgi:hypothetical protein